MSGKPGVAISLVAFDPITTAVTGQVSTAVVPSIGRSEGLTLYAVFAYGSSGTTCKCWVQTSLDNGTTWGDIACFSFTTSAANKVLNCISGTAITAAATLGDAALTADTAVSGVVGPYYRTKITTTGTYAGATSLNVYAVSR
jgi:hypothetical protein